jgi:hypothetical protein
MTKFFNLFSAVVRLQLYSHLCGKRKKIPPVDLAHTPLSRAIKLENP